MKLRGDVKKIIDRVIEDLKPDKLIEKVLKDLDLPRRVYVVAIGKAAWDMAKAISDHLKVEKGIVLTKYGHSKGNLENFEIMEAAHPIPDENSVKGAKKILDFLKSLPDGSTVLFLLSGGASSLYEMPEDGVDLKDIVSVSDSMMKSGADIYEINAIRKRLSKVKGGKTARMFPNLKFVELVISDVLGDRLDVIGSGPLHPDQTTPEEALRIFKKYSLPDYLKLYMNQDLSKSVDNVETHIIANVETACEEAFKEAESLGYKSYILSCSMEGEARELGRFLAKIAKEVLNKRRPFEPPCALIAGGETTVTVRGNGKGGRNQEIALSFALEIEGTAGIVFASFGTDGTDGPTDAAGGIVDGYSAIRMKRVGTNPVKSLENNDSYYALKTSGDLLITGPTGTNVNDIQIVLIKR
jgi:glycerate 2-kinase